MERQPRSIGFVAAGFALLGLILAILIASCVGGGDETASPTVVSTEVVATTTAEVATTAEATTAAATETTAAADTTVAPVDIVDTAAATGGFTTLTTLLDKAGLTETLKVSGPFTVFAPTDAAFEAVPANVLDAREESERPEASPWLPRCCRQPLGGRSDDELARHGRR